MLKETTTIAGAVIATSAALAVIYATVRSKLPATTIQLQTESITALEKQNDLLKENIKELTNLVVELKARVSVLETIPLTTMMETMSTLTATVEALRQIGLENQAYLKSGAATKGTQTTNNNYK